MINHDAVMNGKMLEEMLNQIPEFTELSLDISALREHSTDPFFIALMLYKVIKEKQETTKMLEAINDKYDKIMLHLKSMPSTENQGTGNQVSNQLDLLPEQDEKILKLAEEKGQITAEQVKEAMQYKGINAACQRLNKLFREGHLKKVKYGKKVVYIAGK